MSPTDGTPNRVLIGRSSGMGEYCDPTLRRVPERRHPTSMMMTNNETMTVDLGDAAVGATLTTPPSPRGVVLVLHGAAEPDRGFLFYRRAADALSAAGWAVIRYDRRPAPDMVPLAQQVADASAVARMVRTEQLGADVPVGLWGFSQGAWTAAIAATSIPRVVFLALVGFSAVSPGRQMRFATENYVRAAGYGDAAVRSLLELREAWEAYFRGALARDAAQAVVDRFRDEPWFEVAYVPPRLPSRASIDDPEFFDFEPAPLLAGAGVPALLAYGDNDIDVPVSQSIAAAQASAGALVTVARLAGVGHDLLRQGDVDPRYTSLLTEWAIGLDVG